MNGMEEPPLVLYFGLSVNDAKLMSLLLNRRGIKASHVSGVTDMQTRDKIIAEFRDKKIQVLCNCKVLTIGFDAPKITHVVLGWMTDSRVLYNQMIGRGLRGQRFNGTDVCEIIQVKDHVIDRHGNPIENLAPEEYINEWSKRNHR